MGQYNLSWALTPDGITSILTVEMKVHVEGVESAADARHLVATLLTEPIVRDKTTTQVEEELAEVVLAHQLGLAK